MVCLQEQERRSFTGWRPLIFTPPLSGDSRQVRIRRMPMLHINHQPRIIFEARIFALQPMVPPARRLIAPLHLRTESGVIWECMVPWADDGFHRPVRLHQHVGDVVPIAVLHAANEERWNLDFTQRANAVTPERAVMLMF